MAADLIKLVGTVEDAEGDTDTEAVSISDKLNFKDDSPEITTTAVTPNTLVVDESDLPGGTDAGGGEQSASTNFAGLFSGNAGADQPGTLSGFRLLLAGTATGLIDCASEQPVTVRLGDDGVIYGEVDVDPDPEVEDVKTVFQISVDASGKVTFDLLRAVDHPNPLDHNDSIGLPAGLIKLEATLTDNEGDKATAAVDITPAFQIKDDGPTIDPAQSFDVSFTAGENADGNVGGIFGADGPGAITVTGGLDHPDFKETVNGGSVTYWKDANSDGSQQDSENWFRFSLDDQTGDFKFEVLKTGSATNESINLKSVHPGPPKEIVYATSQFDNASFTIDGLIYSGGQFTDPGVGTSANKAVDDINASAIGFGVKGSNPDQSQQMNHNEAFSVTLDEVSDNVSIGIQNIGNNAKSVDVIWQVGNGLDSNGVLTGAEVTKSGFINNLALLSGNALSEVTLKDLTDANGDPLSFQTAQFAFQFNQDNVSNPTSKNWQSTAGVRIANVAVKQEDTIPEFDFDYTVTKTDCDGDSVQTNLSFHVDPDIPAAVIQSGYMF
jgi:hypothetical protein